MKPCAVTTAQFIMRQTLCSNAMWQPEPPWENLVSRKRKLAARTPPLPLLPANKLCYLYHLSCQLISSPDLICLSCPAPYLTCLPVFSDNICLMWSHFYFLRRREREALTRKQRILQLERLAKYFEESHLPADIAPDISPGAIMLQQL